MCFVNSSGSVYGPATQLHKADEIDIDSEIHRTKYSNRSSLENNVPSRPCVPYVGLTKISCRVFLKILSLYAIQIIYDNPNQQSLERSEPHTMDIIIYLKSNPESKIVLKWLSNTRSAHLSLEDQFNKKIEEITDV